MEKEENFELEIKGYTDDQIISLYWFSDCLLSEEIDLLEKEIEIRKITIYFGP